MPVSNPGRAPARRMLALSSRRGPRGAEAVTATPVDDLTPPRCCAGSFLTACSICSRKRERSRLVKGGGPPPRASSSVPLPRRLSSRSRVATASPMLPSCSRRPRAVTASAPARTQRAARGMSSVTQMSPAPMRSAIQSSAKSGPSSTWTRVTPARAGSRIVRQVTTNTGILWRAATRYASSFTGQASASTKSSSMGGREWGLSGWGGRGWWNGRRAWRGIAACVHAACAHGLTHPCTRGPARRRRACRRARRVWRSSWRG